MKKSITCLIVFLYSVTFAFGQDTNVAANTFVGLWLGTLQVSEEMSMQLAFEIEMHKENDFSAKLNVIEQKAFDIPMDVCAILNDSVHIQFSAAGILYDGRYDPDTHMILGFYKQGGGVFSLDLSKVDKLPLEVHRPQTPIRPFPYEEEEVEFVNEAANVTLSGTFTKPSAGEKFPAVVLIAGSGRNERDETPMGHFLLLSDYLTRSGFAVLRFDKRGVGKSDGDYSAATTFDFAKDAQSGLDYLKERDDVDHKRIGIIGHSEGAVIAPIIASEKKNRVAFIVMMGGVGVNGAELLLVQTDNLLRINGVSEEARADAVARNMQHYTIAAEGGDPEETRRKVLELDSTTADGIISTLQWKWFQVWITLNPAEYIEKVKCPVLAITGEKDLQCDPVQNLGAIEEALKRGGNKNYRTETIKGLNHLFQTSKSGSPTEYEQLPEIIAPEVLEMLVEWINGVVD